MKKIEWRYSGGITRDMKVKPVVLDLLRLLYMLKIKSVIETPFGYAFDHSEDAGQASS